MSGFPVPGGSCLVSYRTDDFDAQGNFIAHGYVREFHLAAAVIESQLRLMFANGQRRLGICIPYYPKGDTFALDSSTGALAIQDRQNLVALIQLALSIGFGEFLIEMIPEWSAAYSNWTNPTVMRSEGSQARTFQPLDYDRDFAFTIDVDNTVASTGCAYRMDLIAEGADVEVCARFWSDWCAQKGGSAGSVGFSMIPVQSSIDNYPKIYANGIVPDVLSVHAYNGPPEMDWPSWKAATAHWPQAYIIGESLCNSPGADAVFANSSDRYFYRLVWPISSNAVTITQDCLTTGQKF